MQENDGRHWIRGLLSAMFYQGRSDEQYRNKFGIDPPIGGSINNKAFKCETQEGNSINAAVIQLLFPSHPVQIFHTHLHKTIPARWNQYPPDCITQLPACVHQHE